MGRASLPFEWETAKLLAELPPEIARSDVLAAWDYITERGDVSVIVRLANTIRGIALFRHRTSKSAQKPRAVRYAVRRLLAGATP